MIGFSDPPLGIPVWGTVEMWKLGGSTQAHSYFQGVNFPQMKGSPPVSQSGILIRADVLQ